MIIKHIIGRLGNQMFQYATVKAFQVKNGLIDEDILLDFDEVFSRANEGGFEDSLSYFNVPTYHIGNKKMSFMQKILLLRLNFVKAINIYKDKILHTNNYSKVMYEKERKLQPLLNRYGLYSFRLGFYDFKNSNSKNKFFFGTFESPKYFDCIKDDLKEFFTPKYGILKKNIDIYDKINKSESVCVTIRRGDFVNIESIKKNLYICDTNYFKKAIKQMQEKVPNARFFVFSDDIGWCKNNMKFPQNTIFESGDDPVWEKLRMMYSCKHFIISNSTFSWWAQYLSRNEKKVVIAPSRWTNDSYKKDEKIDIYEENWCLVDV